MKFVVTSTTLLKQLQMLSGVLNSSNTLPILDNFLFEIKENELTLSASDLETAMSTRMVIQSKEEGIIAIPAKLLLDILKSLPEQPLTFSIDNKTYGIEISSDYGKYKLTGQNGEEFPKAPLMEGTKSLVMQSEALARAINKSLFAKIDYTENNAQFTFDNVTLLCRLIEGKYPNYEAVIPKENPFKLTIDRLDLLNSIKRVSIFANKTTHQVRLKMGGSELNISAEDLDFANEAQERLTCTYAGDDMEIGFNSRFLQEMLSNLTSENVNIEMSAPNRAGILTQVEPDDASEDILMLVMPVMLNS